MRTTSEWKEGLQSAERERRGGGHGLGIAGLGSPRGGAESGNARCGPPRYCNHQPGDICRNPESGKRAVYSCVRLAKVCTTRPNSEAKFRLSSHGSDERLALARALPCGRSRACAACAALSTQSSPQATSGAPIHQRGVPVPTARYSHTARINIGASAPAKALVTHSSRLMFLPKRP